MSWFSRLLRRRRHSAAAYVATHAHRPGSWAEIALPPRVQIVPAPNAPANDATQVYQAHDRPASAFVSPEIPRQAAVRLGFTDGSTVHLDDAASESLEFRSIARSLVCGDGRRSEPK
jgi:hypothetical protein